MLTNVTLIKLKNFTIRCDYIIAYGVLTLPETRQTQAYPAISIWIVDGTEPILITYNTDEERDADLATIDSAFANVNV